MMTHSFESILCASPCKQSPTHTAGVPFAFTRQPSPSASTETQQASPGTPYLAADSQQDCSKGYVLNMELVSAAKILSHL